MRPSLYIAWQYVAFNKGKTATLVACVTLIAILPIAIELLLEMMGYGVEHMEKSDSTPDRTEVRTGAVLDYLH